ncbi:hypothetical protein DESPIG_02497 [Desulfovibrio piger ATCC 29098]|uniref:Uncharacterized protein n=1 Tax=Desulfovibrio piger ATCC 29098 TaxID=411464 RepID=B6WWM8_9BACT|nr:hypothetical protein DESPIG_02497 [Desulfovibrio piger ATCC 29098]
MTVAKTVTLFLLELPAIQAASPWACPTGAGRAGTAHSTGLAPASPSALTVMADDAHLPGARAPASSPSG